MRRQAPALSVARRVAARLLLAGLLALPSCARRAPQDPAPAVAVSNSYFASAAADVLGPAVGVLHLAEPGACPGHFDVRPSQIEQLRSCRLLLRFDFQSNLDAKLAPLTGGGLRIVEIDAPGGLCEPETYRSVCIQIAAAAVAAGLLDEAERAPRLAAVASRLDALDAWAREELQAVQPARAGVLASVHQERLCAYLGFPVLAAFSGADSASVREISAAVQAGQAARLIVANQPEGRRLADALGERLGAPVVVLENFPRAAHQGRFDELFRDNVNRLRAALR